MIFSTDEVTLVKVTRDKYGDETTTTSTHAARVENNNRVIPGPAGEVIRPELVIMAEPSFPGVLGDRIIVSKLRGVATGETRQKAILEVFKGGGFGVSHLEVMA